MSSHRDRTLQPAAAVLILMFFALLPIAVGAAPVEASPSSSIRALAGVDAVDNPTPGGGGAAQPQQGQSQGGQSQGGQSQGGQSQGGQSQGGQSQGGQSQGQSQGGQSQQGQPQDQAGGPSGEAQPGGAVKPEAVGQSGGPEGEAQSGGALPSGGPEGRAQPDGALPSGGPDDGVRPDGPEGGGLPDGPELPSAGPKERALVAAGAAALADGGLFGGHEPPAVITLRLGASVGEMASGSPVTVRSRGLQPNSLVTVTVHSDPVVIASANADAEGAVTIDAALPPGLAPGVHSVVVSGVGASAEDVQVLNALSIDESGVVTAVGQPGDALGVDPDGEMVERSLASGRPIYSPSAHPAAVAAVAVTSAVVVGVAGAAAVGAAGSIAGGATEGVASGQSGSNSNLAYSRVFDPKDLVIMGAVAVGLGDRSPTWRIPGTHRLHDVLARFTAASSRYSVIVPRAMSDGTWARAMFGTNALLLWLSGVVVGIVSLVQSGFSVIPGSIGIILAIVVLGILDAMAGFIAWATISIGALVTLHVQTLQDFLTMVGVGCLAISLSFFANYLRPLRRVGHTGLVGLWDRFADYVIPPVFTAFAAAGIAKGLNGLSGLQIVDQDDLLMIQIVAGSTVVARLALEDVLRKLYPQRSVDAAMPITQPPKTSLRLAAIACRTVITYLLIAAFVGYSWLAIAAAIILSVPLVFGVYESALPTIPGMHRWLPSGITKILVTTVTGVLLVAYIFTSPVVEGLLPGLLVILLIPSAIITGLHVLAPSGRGWTNVWPKRILGVPVYVLAVGLTTGAIVIVQ